MTQKVSPLSWNENKLTLVDQRLLPHKIVYVDSHTIEDIHAAIKDMIVRGAPLIGFTALYGMALWLRAQKSLDKRTLERACSYLESARPTAVNLSFEVRRAQNLILKCMNDKLSLDETFQIVVNFSHQQIKKLADDNFQMAQTAADHLRKLYGERPLRLMTLCNTGFLACGPMGTALGVISHLHSLKRVEHVYAFETRPYLQGSRLTAFELCQEKVPHQIVVEGAMSHIMRTNKIDAIFIGADRIVANGDTANKVGSSTLAIVAKNYGVPFFVVAPSSSFDLETATGEGIEVEMRNPLEILELNGQRIAPFESDAYNPSFDVTNHKHIAGIICEKGLINLLNGDTVTQVLKQ